jgi:transcription elongation factor GreB
MNHKQHHISRAGFDKLKSEWEDLKYLQRPEMKTQVRDAAAEGDRSENAAYTFGKMKLRDIDQRLKRLDFLIDNAIIVDNTRHADGEIVFGARVHLKENSGKLEFWDLVGSAEVNPIENRISMVSPLGKALTGKKQGDKVSLSTPGGQREFEILKVDYPNE